jgi:hypothetical protein
MQSGPFLYSGWHGECRFDVVTLALVVFLFAGLMLTMDLYANSVLVRIHSTSGGKGVTIPMEL